MANSIGQILEIESQESYIKRPIGPMITVKVRDVNKLAGIIRIPSIAEGALPGDTTAQRIVYSRLPNKCRKCRRFGHLAKTCPFNRSLAQGGSTHATNPHVQNEKLALARSFGAQHESQPTTTKQVGIKGWMMRSLVPG
jgi:hypothetical protein